MTISNIPISALETGQPIWLEKISAHVNLSDLIIKGFSFLPTTIGYWFSSRYLVSITNIIGGLIPTTLLGIISILIN